MGNPVVHWQIISKDPEKSARFYGDLFGWEISTDAHLGCKMVDTQNEEGIDGGIWPSPPDGHNFAQLHIRVDDVAAMAERVKNAGGKLLFGPQALPSGAILAVMHDPLGVPFVLTGESG